MRCEAPTDPTPVLVPFRVGPATAGVLGNRWPDRRLHTRHKHQGGRNAIACQKQGGGSWLSATRLPLSPGCHGARVDASNCTCCRSCNQNRTQVCDAGNEDTTIRAGLATYSIPRDSQVYTRSAEVCAPPGQCVWNHLTAALTHESTPVAVQPHRSSN